MVRFILQLACFVLTGGLLCARTTLTIPDFSAKNAVGGEPFRTGIVLDDTEDPGTVFPLWNRWNPDAAWNPVQKIDAGSVVGTTSDTILCRPFLKQRALRERTKVDFFRDCEIEFYLPDGKIRRAKVLSSRYDPRKEIQTFRLSGSAVPEALPGALYELRLSLPDSSIIKRDGAIFCRIASASEKNPDGFRQTLPDYAELARSGKDFVLLLNLQTTAKRIRIQLSGFPEIVPEAPDRKSGLSLEIPIPANELKKLADTRNPKLEILLEEPGLLIIREAGLFRTDVPPDSLLPEWKEELRKLRPATIRSFHAFHAADMASLLGITPYTIRANVFSAAPRVKSSFFQVLTLCRDTGAGIRIVLHPFYSKEDLMGLAEYLGAPPDTGFGRLRARQGQILPWTDVLPSIHLELRHDLFPGMDVQSGQRAQELIRASGRTAQIRDFLLNHPYLKGRADWEDTVLSCFLRPPQNQPQFAPIRDSLGKEQFQLFYVPFLWSSLFSESLAAAHRDLAGKLQAFQVIPRFQEELKRADLRFPTAPDSRQVIPRIDQEFQTFFWLLATASPDFMERLPELFEYSAPLSTEFKADLPRILAARDGNWLRNLLRNRSADAEFFRMLQRTAYANRILQNIFQKDIGPNEEQMRALSNKIIRRILELPDSKRTELDRILAGNVSAQLLRDAFRASLIHPFYLCYVERCASRKQLFSGTDPEKTFQELDAEIRRTIPGYYRNFREQTGKAALFHEFLNAFPLTVRKIPEQALQIIPDTAFSAPALLAAVYGKEEKLSSEILQKSRTDARIAAEILQKRQLLQLTGRSFPWDQKIWRAHLARTQGEYEKSGGVSIGELASGYDFDPFLTEDTIRRLNSRARAFPPALSAADAFLLAAERGIAPIGFYRLGINHFGYASHEFSTDGKLTPIPLTQMLQQIGDHAERVLLPVEVRDVRKFTPNRNKPGLALPAEIPMESAWIFRNGNTWSAILLNRSVSAPRTMRLVFPANGPQPGQEVRTLCMNAGGQTSGSTRIQKTADGKPVLEIKLDAASLLFLRGALPQPNGTGTSR